MVAKRALKNPHVSVVLVSMDEIRKKIFPKPSYSDSERDAAYRCLVLIASFLSKEGITVLLDGTGHKLVWRNFARAECPRFVEVYLKCPVDVCVQRESVRKNNDAVRKKLYESALYRLRKGKKFRGLGKMPGVDEPYEESPAPEVVLDSSTESPKVLTEKAIKKIKKYDSTIFA